MISAAAFLLAVSWVVPAEETASRPELAYVAPGQFLRSIYSRSDAIRFLPFEMIPNNLSLNNRF